MSRLRLPIPPPGQSKLFCFVSNSLGITDINLQTGNQGQFTHYTQNFFSNKLLIYGVLFTLGISLTAMYVPYLRNVFELSFLSLKDWIVPLVVAFSTVLFSEVVKRLNRKSF